jgi:hypothetical protein
MTRNPPEPAPIPSKSPTPQNPPDLTHVPSKSIPEFTKSPDPHISVVHDISLLLRRDGSNPPAASFPVQYNIGATILVRFQKGYCTATTFWRRRPAEAQSWCLG